ncbi:MAG: DUF3944 domain-containing protein [Opitutales bacterium]|nr:DUF3944 domain-containing protein [Opitutales bacterium]
MDITNYRVDEDLVFLQKTPDEYMKILVDILTKDKDGETRLTEELTATEDYKRWYYSEKPWREKSPDLWKLVSAELQYFGANTLASMFRGSGVLYKEILCDVSKSLKVKFDENSSTDLIETHLLNKVLADTVEKMKKENPEELNDFLKEFGLTSGEILKDVGTTSATTIAIAIQTAISLGGIKAYLILNTIIHATARAILGHGLPFAATAPIMKWVSVFAGPIGWTISGILTAIWIATPAMRVTIPAVITVACLRRLQQLNPKGIPQLSQQNPHS